MQAIKSTVRKCKFCNLEFSIPKYLPYYSCKDCRKKEEYERTLVYKPCSICGKMISAAPYTLICRTCAANIKNADVNKQKCVSCHKPCVVIGEEKKCTHCRQQEYRDKLANKCMFCGKPSNKRKVCQACQKQGLITPKKVCLFCNKIYASENANWINNAFCSDACHQQWTKYHSTRDKYLSEDQLKDSIAKLIIENPNITTQGILKELNMNACVLHRKKVSITLIREELHMPAPKRKSSHFENEIYTLLLECGLHVEREKTFSNLLYKRLLRYDFYIPELNLLIEADGQQHYENVDPYGTAKLVRNRDAIKNKYAKDNNINLLRIHYFRIYNNSKVQNFKTLMNTIQCRYRENGNVKLFNCWDGSTLIPISSEACYTKQERSTTIPKGSTTEANAVGKGSCPNE